VQTLKVFRVNRRPVWQGSIAMSRAIQSRRPLGSRSFDGSSVWGTILSTGRNWIIGPGGDIFAYWWVFVPATLAVVLWNLLGDGLNDLLDPRVY